MSQRPGGITTVRVPTDGAHSAPEITAEIRYDHSPQASDHDVVEAILEATRRALADLNAEGYLILGPLRKSTLEED